MRPTIVYTGRGGGKPGFRYAVYRHLRDRIADLSVPAHPLKTNVVGRPNGEQAVCEVHGTFGRDSTASFDPHLM
jgi:hypothetical protein